MCPVIERKIFLRQIQIYYQKCLIPNAMKLVRDSKVTGPWPQKYVPRSRIWFVPSSSTRNCSVLQAFSSPCNCYNLNFSHTHKNQSIPKSHRNSDIDVTVESYYIVSWTFDEIATGRAWIEKAQIPKIPQYADVSAWINHRFPFICVQSHKVITIVEVIFICSLNLCA